MKTFLKPDKKLDTIYLSLIAIATIVLLIFFFKIALLPQEVEHGEGLLL